MSRFADIPQDLYMCFVYIYVIFKMSLIYRVMYAQLDIINIKEGLSSFSCGFKMSIMDVYTSLQGDVFRLCMGQYGSKGNGKIKLE